MDDPRSASTASDLNVINERPPLLIAAINDALDADTRLEVEGLSIEQNADTGRITLDGRVPDIRAKRLAVNTVWGVTRGAFAIEDRLRVRAQAEGELALRDQVVHLIGTEGMFGDLTIVVQAGSHREELAGGRADAGRLEVDIDHAVVTLRGTVPSLSHRRFAEVLAWWAPGCERVDNLLEVAPDEEDTDDEITDVVRMVLEKDRLVDASQLSVGTAGGIVELRGLLGSEEARLLAVRNAWYVPGVWNVVDHIEVRPMG